ncbi:right-handed parallel beta-helix repeat-containing protein [Microbispora sp. H11081]|uniref:right-handed parallel beta-helix repeat-containing protein n=1 Tax=Microbispora sp. H11081 TaxID=2729107 RepID=UPI001474B87A|nr:right-handed parallel beta-helix repeat-containing protein [Microbispora sp. H11081]
MRVVAVVVSLVTAAGAVATLPAAAAVEGWRTAGPLPIGTAAYPVPAGAFFVSPQGDDAANGSGTTPWRTVGRAVKAAPAGATIVLRGGVYHESVEVYGKRLTIQAYPREAVWFDGTESVTGWVRDGSIWRRDGWTVRFDNTDPTAGGGPAWHMVGADNPVANWPDQVFVDGRQQRQVAGRDQVVPGTFAVDYNRGTLYLGSDPAGHDVRATTLTEALYLNTAHGSAVLGIGFRRYATPIKRVAAVKGFADDLRFENDVFADTALAGLSIKGARITVRHNAFVRNGQLGLHGHRTQGAVVTGNLMEGNNWERFEQAPVSGGMKITTSSAIQVIGNRSQRNRGPGLWLDESVSDAVIARNLAWENTGHGIDYEISARALLVGNFAADNGRNGLYVNESSDVRLWNNTALRNGESQINIIDGAREQADQNMPWNVSGVEVRNNVLQGGGAGPQISVQDLTGRRTAAQMATLDYNVYIRMGEKRESLIKWVDRSRGGGTYTSLTGIQAQIERNGREIPAENAQSGLSAGAALPSDVAGWLGAQAGARNVAGAPY